MKLSQISVLFEQAIEITNSVARDDFVRNSCLDESNRNRLGRLISAHFQEHSLVDTHKVAAHIARDLCDDADDESPVREGDQLGEYKLLKRIGEGGMGYVFMAEQLEPIQRSVAIKVIKASSSSRQVLTRFEAERSALARLDHPNITRIFDAGEAESGAPYFVMELVRGDSLTRYCDSHKLTVKQRVELAERVCLAVHHAHQKGILHRDIKPSNIMVTLHDGKPTPKIIDFGIAKAFDRPLVNGTTLTRFGDMVGTPQYMSPEQAEQGGLDLDVRTDIYSLGAVLFELLTGTPPLEAASLEGKGVLGLMEAVRDNDTESPSTRVTRVMAADDTLAPMRATDRKHLSRYLRGELDWITLKSLARDRSERYESAAAMAADLRAYLDGDVVSAAAPSFSYQARKLLQRHRTMGMALVACAVMMAAVTIVSLAWGVSNNRLKKLATARAAELDFSNKQLEEQGTVLRDTLERAQNAEQKSLKLVHEKRLQAVFERAIRVHVEQALAPALETTIGEIASDELVGLENGDLKTISEAIKKTVQQSFNEKKVLPLKRKPNSVIRTVEVADVQVYAHVTPAPTKPAFQGGESLSPKIEQMLLHDPEIFGGIVIEEFRAEFGEKHEQVATGLVQTSRVGLAGNEWNPDIVESWLREAIEILRGETDSQKIATRIEARILLVELLRRSQRTPEATSELERAREGFDLARSQLDEHHRDSLNQEFARVKQLLMPTE